jgi:hypothetical protein
MKRAQLFANAYADNSTPTRTAHIYRDGIILAVPVSIDTHLSIFKCLKMRFSVIETARSDDGMFSAFLLAEIDPDNAQIANFAFAFTDGYVDHRQCEECNTIEQVTALLQQKLARHEESSEL